MTLPQVQAWCAVLMFFFLALPEIREKRVHVEALGQVPAFHFNAEKLNSYGHIHILPAMKVSTRSIPTGDLL